MSPVGPPWSAPAPRTMCNFHGNRPAVIAYAGTPMCQACADHMGRNGNGK